MTPFPPISDAVQQRYRAWIAMRRAWLATLGDETEAGRRREELVHAVLSRHIDALASLCPTSCEDLAAQLHVQWIEFGPHWHDDGPHNLDDAEPQDQYVSRLWQAASGRDGWPRGPTEAEAGLQ